MIPFDARASTMSGSMERSEKVKYAPVCECNPQFSGSGLNAGSKLVLVVSWFRRARLRDDVPVLKPRRTPVVTHRVELADLAPDLVAFLGQAACVQLARFQTLARALDTAPTLEARLALTRPAEVALARYHTLVRELERRDAQPALVMARFSDGIDGFRQNTLGRDWYETVVTAYITGGFLDDFFLRLAEGLRDGHAPRAIAVLGGETGAEQLLDLLRLAIDADPPLASRLALWGRRLVGDTMLVARAVLVASSDRASDEAQIEPVFTELIAAHTRRMDALGLTA